MGRILFVSHDATRTGAPIVLLHLLRWLKKERAHEFSVVLLNGGELEDQFHDVATTYVWNIPANVPHRWRRYVNKVVDKLSLAKQDAKKRNEQFILSELKKNRPDVIYGNTVVSSELIVQLKSELNCPVICHIHELKIAIERYFGTDRFGRQLPSIDLLIVASDAVRNNLMNTYSISDKPVAKVYEYVPSVEEVEQKQTPASIREALNIPFGSKVVAASGTLDWRKSPDLFVQMAAFMRQQVGEMPYFLWIGGEINSIAYEELMYDARLTGVADYVRFIGARSNPLDYLRIADVFVLTSREDPYPLVCLEAATLGKPVVCFDQAGGMPEFVEEDCGAIVPFLRADLMAEAVHDLLTDTEKARRAGHNALSKVRTRHSVEVAGSQILEQIDLLCLQEKTSS